MLKILKLRVVIAQSGNYTAKHTGKTGFVSVQPKGGAPIPYSFIEEISSNVYPSVRDFVPKDFRSYTDSYYDLRNKQYKYWYDKWGKPHINKWWKQQLDETLRIKKAWEKYSQKSVQNKYYPRTQYNGPTNNSKWSKYSIQHRKYCNCRCERNNRKVGYRPRQRSFKRRRSWFY